MDASELLLLGTAMAISAIPTGLPAFVSGLLSYGAKQLADSKAVVKNLTDVETLGATSAINTDKTGTLTMNQMMVSVIYANGAWFNVEGQGYRKTGAITSVAAIPVPDFSRTSRWEWYSTAMPRSPTTAVWSATRPRPRWSCLPPSSASTPKRPAGRIHGLAEVPFDSEYKFMATFHRVNVEGGERVIELVKGGPDVVLARCARDRVVR